MTPSSGYWNGEAAQARRVRVRIPTWSSAVDPPLAWWRDAQEREWHAVEVTYNGHTFFLDDSSGEGWAKVTVGHGSPRVGHRSLPDRCEVIEERGTDQGDTS